MSEMRYPIRLVVAGQMRSGKTYFTINDIIKPAIGKRKVLILMLYDHPDYSNYQKIELSKLKSWCELPHKLGPRVCLCSPETIYSAIAIVTQNMNCNSTAPGLVVLEDASRTIKTGNNQAHKAIADFIYTSRNINLDVVVQVHSLKRCPVEVTHNATHIVLFKTKDVLDKDTADKVGEAAFEQLQKYVPILRKASLEQHLKFLIQTDND
jgi:hypothetical protein